MLLVLVLVVATALVVVAADLVVVVEGAARLLGFAVVHFTGKTAVQKAWAIG